MQRSVGGSQVGPYRSRLTRPRLVAAPHKASKRAREPCEQCAPVAAPCTRRRRLVRRARRWLRLVRRDFSIVLFQRESHPLSSETTHSTWGESGELRRRTQTQTSAVANGRRASDLRALGCALPPLPTAEVLSVSEELSGLKCSLRLSRRLKCSPDLGWRKHARAALALAPDCMRASPCYHSGG